MPTITRKQQNIPPFEKGGSGGISIVILVTQKRCHPESPRLASRVIPRSVSDEGSAVENTDGRMA
jgi:hypothetical protein